MHYAPNTPCRDQERAPETGKAMKIQEFRNTELQTNIQHQALNMYTSLYKWKKKNTENKQKSKPIALHLYFFHF